MSEAQVNSVYRVTDDGIYGFFKEHRFLSNFHPININYQGLRYSSTEAAYQAQKCANPKDKVPFTSMTPSESKKAGRKVELREDWEGIKLKIMLDLNILKFEDPVLRKLLLDTGDKHLEERNWWMDKFYGTCNGEGENKLGFILMVIRQRIIQTLKT